MSWWNATVPLWQVMAIVSVYVIYKELVKILLKAAIKRVRRKRIKEAPAGSLFAEEKADDPTVPRTYASERIAGEH